MTPLLGDVAACLAEISETLVLVRHDPARLVNGRVEEPETTEIQFSGSMQPPTTNEAADLPEGQLARGVAILFTTQKLFAASSGRAAVGDVVRRSSGEEWEVAMVEDWSHLTGHYRARLVRRPR